MAIQLRGLMNEMEMFKKNPPQTKLPAIRDIGAKIIKYITHNIGRGIIKTWEVDDRHGRGVVRLYLPLMHHNPQEKGSMQPIIQIIKASERFNAPFRMFGSGNLICIVIGD